MQDQYHRLNYPMGAYDTRPSQKILVRRPASGYEMPNRQPAVQAPASDMQDNAQYANVRVERPLKPLYREQPKIRHPSSDQEMPRGGGYPMPKPINGQGYSETGNAVKERTSAEVQAPPRVKPRRPHVAPQPQTIMKGLCLQPRKYP